MSFASSKCIYHSASKGEERHNKSNDVSLSEKYKPTDYGHKFPQISVRLKCRKFFFFEGYLFERREQEKSQHVQ